MSRSWLSEVRWGRSVGALAWLMVAAGWAMTPSIGEARIRGSAVVDSGGSVRRISISERGIVVEREGSRDTTVRWSREDTRRVAREAVRERVRERIRARGGLLEVEDSGTGIVRIWSDAEVPAGKVVDGDVVAVFGSVTVAGEVSGDVVAVFGSVRLKPGAKVEGDVASIGGVLEQAEGVTIGGESVQLGLSPITWGLPGISVLLLAVIAGWLVSMFVGWIFALLFPSGMLRVATVVERRPAASFFLGLLSVPGFCVAVLLLCITVIGIPLGVLLPMVYALMGYLGQLAATCVLGARLTRRSLDSGLMTPLIVGTLFVAALFGVGIALLAGEGVARTASLFLGLSGALLLLGLGTLGTGAFLLSRFGTRPHEVVWRGHAPAPAAGVSAVPPPATP